MIRYNFKAGDRIRYISEADPDHRAKFEFHSHTDIAGKVGTVEKLDGDEIRITLDGIHRWSPAPGAEVELLPQWVDVADIRPETLTVQQSFDIATHHMIEVLQGHLAADSFGNCVYETEDGRQCAVGGLLVRKVDRLAIYGPATAGRVRDALATDGVPADAINMLRAIQGLHDVGILDVEQDNPSHYRKLTPGRRKYFWKRTLRRYAKRLGLVPGEWLGEESPKKARTASTPAAGLVIKGQA